MPMPTPTSDQSSPAHSTLHNFHVNVKSFGAVGDGVTDDTAEIQAALDACGVAGGGIVFFPSGTYEVSSGLRTTAVGTVADDGHALVINYDNIHIQGAGSAQSKISHVAYGGGDPEASWQTVGGALWRGGGIFIVSGISGTRISDIEIDGNTLTTGDQSYPANVSTGDGWDLTHKGVWLFNDGTFDDTLIENCHIHGYRGEIIFGAGSSVGRVTVRNSELNDTNGDCFSVTGETLVEGCELYNAANAAVEDIYVQAPALYRHNLVHDCLNGFMFGHADASGLEGPLICEGNVVHTVDRCGVQFVGATNARVANNTFVDCAFETNYRVITVTSSAGRLIQDITILGNTFWAVNQNTQSCLLFSDYGGASPTMVGIVVTNNHAATTAAGVVNGKAMVQSFQLNTITDTSAIIFGNTDRGMTSALTSGISVNTSASATTPGSVVKKVEAFDMDGTSLGYIPVYDAIS
jgi:hypothetical protein